MSEITTLLIALFSMQLKSAAELDAVTSLRQMTKNSELPNKIPHENLLHIHDDARFNGRVFETSIVNNPPWPQNIRMNVTINQKHQCGIYAYYARIFGTEEWSKADMGVSIEDGDGHFNVIMEIPRHELGFDCILVGKFYHSEFERLEYFTSEIWHRPSTLASSYSDDVLKIYDNGQPNLHVEYARAFSWTTPRKNADSFDIDITLRAPGVYGHYSRRIGETEWKRSTCAPDKHYERAGFNSNGTLKVWSPLPKDVGFQYRLIGRAENDLLHLETSKVMTITNCCDDFALLMLTDGGDIDCDESTSITYC